MAFTKEVPDEILNDCHGPDDFYGPEGIMKQLARAPVERTTEAGLTGHPGYEKHDQGQNPPPTAGTAGAARSCGPTAGRWT